jgi:hypothetical protein
MIDDPEFEEFMQELLYCGAAYATGEITDDGDIVYKFNMDILKEVRPELYEVFMEELDADLLHLYELGLVDIDYNENLEATFRISEKGRQYMEDGILEDYIKENKKD